MNLSFALLFSILQFSIVQDFVRERESTTTCPADNTIAMSPLDVLIIGGGPAGLSAATGLARQLYTAVVFDSGVYRNNLAYAMHNVLTWDHQSPAAFRQKGRDDLLKRYTTISFQDTEVKSVAKTPNGLFEARDIEGKLWIGRKLLIATGVRDVFPDIEGYGDCWAKGMYVEANLCFRELKERTESCQISLPFLSRIRREKRELRRGAGNWRHGEPFWVASPRPDGQAADSERDNLYGRSGRACANDGRSRC